MGENATVTLYQLLVCSKVWTSRPVAASHSMALPYQVPESRCDPSGENATALTPNKRDESLDGGIVRSSWPDAASQTFVVRSRLLPAGRIVRSGRPVAVSQSLVVPSRLPDSTRAPSDENATATTGPE